MLDRLASGQSLIIQLLMSSDSRGVDNLSAGQWSAVAQLLSTLRPLVELTSEMTNGYDTAYPAQSVVIPLVVGLRGALMTGEGGLDLLREQLLHLVDENLTQLLDDSQLCAATIVGLCVRW